MKMKSPAILLIALTIFFAGCSQDKAPETNVDKAESTSEAATASDAGVGYVVYYMTTSARCASCYKIENWTKEAVNKYFADEIKSGEMRFEMVDIEEPENEHYVDHYGLYTKSVIVSRKVDGKEVSWKNLDRVWKLLGDQGEFMNYIRGEIETFKSGAES